MGRPEIDDILPVSSLQEGILFHVRFDGASSIYWNQLVATVRGDLDVDAFRSAWDAVARRHAALRTSFVLDGRDRPLQIVSRRVDVPWSTEDWRGATRDEVDSRLAAFLEKDGARGIDISRPPLFRCALFRTGEREHELVWSQHHAIIDGWSWPIVFREVLLYHAAIRKGDEPSLPAARPFGDWVRWAGTKDLDRAREFFREALRGFDGANELGIAWRASRDAFDVREARKVSREIDAETSRGIRETARRLRVTPSVLAEASWARAIAVTSAREDVVFGVTLATRPPELTGIESTVGPLINTLPLRIATPGDVIASRTLEETLARFGELQRFDFTPLAEAQSSAGLRGGQPLFETILVFESFPLDEGSLVGPDGVALERLRAIEHDNFAVTAIVLPLERFVLSLDFDRRRIDEDAAERLLDRFARILAELARDPDRPWREISALPHEERNLTLLEWNATDVPVDPESTIDELVSRTAATNGDREAIRASGRSLSYRELMARADEVASALSSLGVVRGEPIGIALERAADLVPCILGVMRFGSPWVPLDPEYPRERLRMMVEDASPGAFIVHASIADRTPLEGRAHIEIGADGSFALRGERAPNAERHCDGAPSRRGDRLAYIIFTSGSTGRPKGVEITHRSAVNFLTSMRERPGMTRDDVLLAVTSLSFDISLLELFLPLIAGGTVVIARRDQAIDGRALATLIEEHDVTVLQGTPGTWRLLFESGWRGSSELRAFVGGEALPVDLARELLPSTRELWNLYGPTETTVWSTIERVENADDITIGRPIANTRVYVLDRCLDPVPIGVAGEIWIGGEGVARGYRNALELTAEAFRPDPFAGREGARMYRTGDIGAYRPDGRLVCLGRRDAQVKLRGFRIELGEIESVLAGVEGVREVAAAVLDDASGSARLVAYVAADGSRPPEDLLRERAALELPEWMVPSRFVFLDALPRTANGKLDRKSLPAPGTDGDREDPSHVEPRTPLERALVPIWKEVLGVERIGIDDNFFALGGHSILATRLVHRMSSALHADLPLRALFEAPTIRALAERCATIGDRGAAAERFAHRPWRSLLSVQPRGDRRPVYLVAGAHADEEVFLRYLSNLIPYLGLDQPVYGFRARGLDGDAMPHDSVEEMARDYISELRELDPGGPYVIAGECIGGVVAWEMACQLRAAGARVPLLLLLDTWRPRPLSKEQWAEFRKDRRRRRWQRFVARFEGAPWPRKISIGARFTAQKIAERFRLSEDARRARRIQKVERKYPWTISRFRPTPYAGDVVVIANEEDHEREPGLGWESLAEGGFRVEVVPGTHLSRLTEHAPETAKRMRAAIDVMERARVERAAKP